MSKFVFEVFGIYSGVFGLLIDPNNIAKYLYLYLEYLHLSIVTNSKTIFVVLVFMVSKEEYLYLYLCVYLCLHYLRYLQ